MDLNLGLGQRPQSGLSLNLAPQLLTWLRLLQCPTLELGDLVREELDSNPALELDDRPTESDGPPDAERADRETGGAADGAETASASDDDLDARIRFLGELESEWRYDVRKESATLGHTGESEADRHQRQLDSLVSDCSLQEHLRRQLATLRLPERDRALADLIVGSIDERGYLTVPALELAGLTGASVSRVESVLEQVQTMDPPGIGARDLRECLLLQMDALTPPAELEAEIVRDHLPALAEHRYDEIASALGIAEDAVAAAVRRIATLDPCPGCAYSRPAVEYVEPDVTIRRADGAYQVELNDDFVPRLRISASCHALLQQKVVAGADRAYVRRKLRAASFLIQGIRQRNETLRRVTGEIVRVQRSYLDREDGELNPLTMAKVASALGVHETTVSRAIAHKYVATPRGLFEMRHFFRAGYLCHDGSALTPDAVKTLIAELLDNEPAGHPLTDLDISARLRERGLTVARRTVAKYREELGLPGSKERSPARAAHG